MVRFDLVLNEDFTIFLRSSSIMELVENLAGIAYIDPLFIHLDRLFSGSVQVAGDISADSLGSAHSMKKRMIDNVHNLGFAVVESSFKVVPDEGNPETEGGNEDLPIGIIVGCAVGGVAVIGIIIGIAYKIKKEKEQRIVPEASNMQFDETDKAAVIGHVD